MHSASQTLLILALLSFTVATPTTPAQNGPGGAQAGRASAGKTLWEFNTNG